MNRLFKFFGPLIFILFTSISLMGQSGKVLQVKNFSTTKMKVVEIYVSREGWQFFDRFGVEPGGTVVIPIGSLRCSSFGYSVVSQPGKRKTPNRFYNCSVTIY